MFRRQSGRGCQSMRRPPRRSKFALDMINVAIRQVATHRSFAHAPKKWTACAHAGGGRSGSRLEKSRLREPVEYLLRERFRGVAAGEEVQLGRLRRFVGLV